MNDDINKCPFCKSDIVEVSFAESDNFLAIYNTSPILPGHSLVIPKRHAESLLELSDSELCEFVMFGKDVVKILQKAFKTNAFNWTIQEKEEAGQTVPHLHIHIIPRRAKDLPQPGDWYPLLRQQSEIIDGKSRSCLTREEIIKVVNHIKTYVKND